MELIFNRKKLWEIPKPALGNRVQRPLFERCRRWFYNEFYTTGHKISDPVVENITINTKAASSRNCTM